MHRPSASTSAENPHSPMVGPLAKLEDRMVTWTSDASALLLFAKAAAPELNEMLNKIAKLIIFSQLDSICMIYPSFLCRYPEDTTSVSEKGKSDYIVFFSAFKLMS